MDKVINSIDLVAWILYNLPGIMSGQFFVRNCIGIHQSYLLKSDSHFKKMTENDPSAVEDLAVSIWLPDPGSPNKMADLRKITGNPLGTHRHRLICMNFEMALVTGRTADTMLINIPSMGSNGEWRGFWAIGEEKGLTVTGQSNSNGRKQWD